MSRRDANVKDVARSQRKGLFWNLPDINKAAYEDTEQESLEKGLSKL